MVRQFRHGCRFDHRRRPLLHVFSGGSLGRGPRAGKRLAGAALTVVLCLGFASGCVARTPVPRFDVALAGAQIATEFVDTWLGAADTYRFEIEQLAPVFLSSNGFDHLAAGKCDLACTDRPISRAELERFGEAKPQGYRVAFYGFALYVHAENPLDSIFAGHVQLLFRKQVTDWKQLASEPVARLEGPIRLYGPRKASRGGMILMRQAGIWFGEPTWMPLDSDQEIIARVAADPGALGFATIGYEHDVRYLGLRMERTGRPAFPSLEEIESERYGLAKVIYVYVPARPSPAAEAVLTYLFSPAGRQAIEATDVWPIPWERARVATPP